MEKYIFDRNNGLWYELQGDYYIPCLALDEANIRPIGIWGRKHLRYIKEYRPALYTDLQTSGKLSSYLAEVDNRAKEMLELLVKQMAAIPLIDTAQLDMTGYEDVESLDVSNFRIMSIGDLSTDFNEKWDNEIGTLN